MGSLFTPSTTPRLQLDRHRSWRAPPSRSCGGSAWRSWVRTAPANPRCTRSRHRSAGHRSAPRQYFVLGAGKIAGTLADSDDGANATLFIDQDEPPWSRLLPAANELCGGERELRRLTLVDALETEASFGDYAGLEMAEAWRLQHVSACAPGALGWGACAYDATPLNALSPGAARKAYLALALAKPDVACLLLDEPTNHLDLPSRIWLREALIASGKVR